MWCRLSWHKLTSHLRTAAEFILTQLCVFSVSFRCLSSRNSLIPLQNLSFIIYHKICPDEQTEERAEWLQNWEKWSSGWGLRSQTVSEASREGQRLGKHGTDGTVFTGKLVAQSPFALLPCSEWSKPSHCYCSNLCLCQAWNECLHVEVSKITIDLKIGKKNYGKEQIVNDYYEKNMFSRRRSNSLAKYLPFFSLQIIWTPWGSICEIILLKSASPAHSAKTESKSDFSLFFQNCLQLIVSLPI